MTRLKGFALAFGSMWALGLAAEHGRPVIRAIPLGLGFPLFFTGLVVATVAIIVGFVMMIAGDDGDDEQPDT